MTRTFSKLFAAGLISAVTGFSSGSTEAYAATASGSVFQTGDTQGAIHVISENNQTWTTIKGGFGFVDFPVQIGANASAGFGLSHVWVVQGNVLDLDNHAIYDSGSLGDDVHHEHTGTLTGGALHLSAQERTQIVALCNSNLNQLSQEQSQHEEEVQVPLTLVMQTVQPEGGIVSEGLDWEENTNTTNFPVQVICEPFTKPKPPMPADEAADVGNSKIVQVELGLSTTGAVVGGPLIYTGSCPMGITLNMRWVTNIGSELKTYIKHKDLAGKHNWTSQTFSVNTNQPAAGGNWKKEMTDLISIPFEGAVAVNGPGGANAHNLPNGGYQFNPGSGGGFNPAASYGASNSGTSNGLTQYIGFFQLVAYKNKQIVPLPNLDGSTENVTVYEDFKASGWRKYIVTCEPQQNTSIPQGPTGVFYPGQQDTHQIDTAGGLVTTHPATNNPRIPVVPGVVTTGQNNKAADIVRKRDEVARRKAIAKRKAIAAALAKRKAAALAKRKAAAALAKRKAIAAALARRKAIAAALAKRKAAFKRRNVAPVRTMQLRRR